MAKVNKEAQEILGKISKVIKETEPGGYEKLRDVLCKELFTSCGIDNEQRLKRMAKHQGVSSGMVVLNAAKETYDRIKPQLTKEEQAEVEIELNRNVGGYKGEVNHFYRMGVYRGNRSGKAKIFHTTTVFPLEYKPLIQKAAQEAGLSIAGFVRQAIYEKLGIQPGQKKKITKDQREDYTTVDTVLPMRDLTGV